jgi:hypothetical protein
MFKHDILEEYEAISISEMYAAAVIASNEGVSSR